MLITFVPISFCAVGGRDALAVGSFAKYTSVMLIGTLTHIHTCSYRFRLIAATTTPFITVNNKKHKVVRLAGSLAHSLVGLAWPMPRSLGATFRFVSFWPFLFLR